MLNETGGRNRLRVHHKKEKRLQTYQPPPKGSIKNL